MTLSIARLSAATAMMCMCAGAQAAITVYTTQASFLSAISSPATDTFDNLSIGDTVTGPINRMVGSYGYSANTSPGSLFFIAGSGSDAWLSSNTATDSIVFLSFSGGVQAAGGFFFGSDFDGFFAPGTLSVSATDADGTVTETIIGATTGSFLGFVSNIGLAGLEVAALQPSTDFLWPTLNDLTLGVRAVDPTVIPLPGAFALMFPALLMAGMTAARRRR
jgi:hypothetical protein